MNKKEYLVETKDLTHIYGGSLKVLNNINLKVVSGEFIAIMGPSGSGKTTLLNLIGALDSPSSGQVLFDGVPLSEIQNLDSFRSQSIGFVFQIHNLIPTLTARENVEVPMHEIKSSRVERKNKASELLEIVGLSERVNHRPTSLSGGERQRVAIARALANEPQLILADEPTGNLDSTSGAAIMSLLRELNRKNHLTIIIVTHDPLVARATDRIVELKDGQIVNDISVRNRFIEDLRAFQKSSLGEALYKGKIPKEIEGLGFEIIIKDFQAILSKL